MKMIVTGGAGFIGANFVYYELREHPEDQIVCYDALTYAGNIATLAEARKSLQFTFVRGDIADRAAVYALFSFISVPFLVFILPRMFFSLHPSPVINGAGRLDMDTVMLGTLLLSLLDATLVYVWLMKRRLT